MKRILVLSLILAISTIFAFPQGKELTLKQAVLGQRSEFGVTSLRNLSWRPESTTYTFIKDYNLIEVDIKTKKENVILSLTDLNIRVAIE